MEKKCQRKQKPSGKEESEAAASWANFDDEVLERSSVAEASVSEQEDTPVEVGLGEAIDQVVASQATEPPRPATATATASQSAPKELLVEPGELASGGDVSVGVVVQQDEPHPVYELPTLSLLDKHEREVGRLDENGLRELAGNLEQKLADFGVKGEVTAIRPGPIITVFVYLPETTFPLVLDNRLQNWPFEHAGTIIGMPDCCVKQL